MIVLINPNSTEAMTQTMLATARNAVPHVSIEGWTSHDGPEAIQGEEDGRRAIPPLLKLIEKASRDGASGILIGCFDDTGLEEARAIASCPVLGIGQAAYYLAALAGGRFSVVTTLDVSVPILEANIRRYQLSGHLSKVRASGVPVLELELNPAKAADRILDEIRTAEVEDDISTVVLGCGGMTWLPKLVQEESHLRVVDGVMAGTALLHTL